MNDDVAVAQTAVAVVQPAPPPKTLIVPVPMAASMADERPARHRRGFIILVGGFMAAALLGLAGLGASAMAPDSDRTSSATPKSSIPGIGAVGTVATPTPTPKATPTKAPTKAPTRRPVVTPKPPPKSTPKPTPTPVPTPVPTPTPTPAMVATWISYTATTPTTNQFRIQTLAGASCQITRTRAGYITRVSAPFIAAANGVATLTNWTVDVSHGNTTFTWPSDRTFTVRATCTLGTRTAQTTSVSIASP